MIPNPSRSLSRNSESKVKYSMLQKEESNQLKDRDCDGNGDEGPDNVGSEKPA